ncbi:MAG: response regulator [Planctomycetes bacterium]|nr:response regulator [Planctomycetota bacterium]
MSSDSDTPRFEFPGPNSTQKILIVDDKKDNLVALRRVLSVLDAEVVEATTGNEALVATLDHHFAVAILDVGMPGMSGFELAEHLRGDKKTRVIPVVFLTASYDDEQHMFKGYEAGGVDYIMKPYAPEALLGKVRVFLEMDRYRRELQRHRDHLETLVTERTATLEKRIKELRCLYSVSRLTAEPAKSIEDAQKAAVDLIPPGWQYPEITCARITLEGRQFATPNFRDTAWKQSADIILSGETVGTVEVCYLEERPESDEGPFFKEEQYLVNDIARQFGVMIQRERAEEALRERERYFRSLMYNMHEDIVVIDRDYVITDVNNTFVQTVGMTRDEVIGKRCYEVSHGYAEPCDRAGQRCAAREVFETGKPEAVHHVHTRADGSKAHFDILLSPVKDEAGNVTNVVEARRDVTNLMEAYEAMRNSEERYRTIFEGAAEGILVADTETRRFTYANPALCRMLGYSEEELTRLGVADIHPEEDLPHVISEFGAQARGERPLAVEIPCLRKDGSVFYADIRTAPAVINGRTCNVSFLLDVTERKRAQEELSRLAKFPSDNPNPIMRIAHDGAITYANESSGPLLKSWGCAEGEPLPAEFRQMALEAISTGVRKEAEVACDAAVYSLTFTPIPGTDYLDLYGRDVTEQRQLENQFRQAQKLESIGRLAGGVAHDFNNLLTGMKGLIGFALEAAEPGSQTHEDLTEALDLADRAAGLSRQLLAFSRRQTLAPMALNVNELIADQIKMLTRLLGEDIDLQFSPAPDLGNVRADPGQIEQVIMNLAVNARDAMPDGGRLTIETDNVELGQEYASKHMGVTPGPYVMIAVSDTGCGMDDRTRAQIFDPFFTTKELGKGTGLGLSTVYGIAKQHGGNIWVYSEPGKGATLKVYLPRVAAEAEKLGPRSKFVIGGAETILLAEDDDAVRGVGRRHLEALGYTVLCAASAREAEQVARAHEGRIDLLLTDVVMPDRNGRELYESLAANQAGLKVLYMSGYTDNAIVHRGVLKAGIPFLQKPFEKEDLATRVRQALEG